MEAVELLEQVIHIVQNSRETWSTLFSGGDVQDPDVIVRDWSTYVAKLTACQRALGRFFDAYREWKPIRKESVRLLEALAAEITSMDRVSKGFDVVSIVGSVVMALSGAGGWVARAVYTVVVFAKSIAKKIQDNRDCQKAQALFSEDEKFSKAVQAALLEVEEADVQMRNFMDGPGAAVNVDRLLEYANLVFGGAQTGAALCTAASKYRPVAISGTAVAEKVQKKLAGLLSTMKVREGTGLGRLASRSSNAWSAIKKSLGAIGLAMDAWSLLLTLNSLGKASELAEQLREAAREMQNELTEMEAVIEELN